MLYLVYISGTHFILIASVPIACVLLFLLFLTLFFIYGDFKHVTDYIFTVSVLLFHHLYNHNVNEKHCG